MCDYSPDITFVLFTFNEERRIERAIRSFQGYGHILVVDNDSSDRTRDLALRYGCQVLIHKNTGWVEDEVTVAHVKATVTSPWIYWGYADEMVEATTMKVIMAAVNTGAYDIINIVRKNYYYGEFCHDLFASRTNRIFKKDFIDFTGNKIHGFGRIVEGARAHELSSLYFVHHFISNTAKSYLFVLDRYTDTESSEDRPVPGLFRLFMSTGKIFLVDVVLKRGYRTGMPGWFLTVHMIYNRWLSAMKLYEKAAQLDRESIEQKNNTIRDKIIRPLP